MSYSHGMEAFDLKLERLRKSGIRRGFKDHEMDQCMLEAFEGARQRLNARSSEWKFNAKETSTDPVTENGKTSRWKILAIVICLCLLFIYSYGSELPLPKQVENELNKLEDGIFWYWRILVTPLASTFDLSGFYQAKCMINNPLKGPLPTRCNQFKYAPSVRSLDQLTEEEFTRRYSRTVLALVVKKKHQLVSYPALRDWYRQNEDFFKGIPTSLRSSSHNVWYLGDLLTKYTELDIKALDQFHAEWSTSSVNPSRLLRKLFPRPDFIPQKAEIVLQKLLFVDSPGGGAYDLLTNLDDHPPNIWYVQGSGSRQMILEPNPSCADVAHPINVTMAPGDILYAHLSYWGVRSAPVHDQDNTDISVSFVGFYQNENQI